MKAIYLSHFIDTLTPLYGGRTDGIRIKAVRSHALGDSCDSLELSLPGHTGTHVDLPRHFCPQGKTLSDYAPEDWHFNSVALVDCSMEDLPGRLHALPDRTDLLLVRTGFELYRGQEKYWAQQPVVEPSLSDILRERLPQLRAVGFDMISLSSYQNRELGREAHRRFLCKNDILLLEDMHLAELRTSPLEVWVSPLLIRDADGVPCTVIAHV